EKLAYEKELLGMFISGHPLQPLARLIERYATHAVEGLAGVENRGMARVAGLVTAVQEGVSKKSGKRYAMVTLEDLTGSVQVLVMNDNYEKFRPLFIPNQALLVLAEVNTGEDRPKLFPQEILPLEDAPRKLTRQVHFRLRAQDLGRDRLEAARALAEAHPGRVPLFLAIRMPRGETVFLEPNDRYYVSPSRGLEEAVNAAFGPGTFHAVPDRSLPERTPRRWERRAEGASGE
ncbi:MAG: OB-fold nucleic acid binding domain-containing protein, partial [Verrucomicrobiota bacterium]